MKSIRTISLTIAATTLVAALACSGQQVRIENLDMPSGRLGFTLSPTGTVSDYSCAVEWRSTLSAGGWTNSWYKPLVPFSQSNGMFYAALPRFFRISCVTGQTTNTPAVNYTVTGVIPSKIVNGFICWTNSGNTGLVYYVEQATAANGVWSDQWICQTNIHTAATVTNFFGVPMFFRVVTIAEGGELPW